MQFTNEVLVDLLIFALGLAGFWVSRHIYKHKSNAENPLVCPINFDCHAVVHSDYSKFFGMPVEMLGMAYYAVISLSYLAYAFMGSVMPEVFLNFLAVLSLLAFAFSLYLIAVQIFVLKKGLFMVHSLIRHFSFDFSLFIDIT